MGRKESGPLGSVRADLIAGAVWQEAGGKLYADRLTWWEDGSLLARIGPALASLHEGDGVTVVAGIQSSGYLLGPLVAAHLRVGFLGITKGVFDDDKNPMLRRTTPPDYANRSLTLAMRRRALRHSDRVLLVDDWIETGAQAATARALISDADANWVGVATVVDATEASVRRDLNVKALIYERELP